MKFRRLQKLQLLSGQPLRTLQVSQVSKRGTLQCTLMYGEYQIPNRRREHAHELIALVALWTAKTSAATPAAVNAAYSKPNKPPDNVPQYKKYIAVVKSLAPIEKLGLDGKVDKAALAWSKAAEALSDYLASVDMPGDLSDALYSSS